MRAIFCQDDIIKKKIYLNFCRREYLIGLHKELNYGMIAFESEALPEKMDILALVYENTYKTPDGILYEYEYRGVRII